MNKNIRFIVTLFIIFAVGFVVYTLIYDYQKQQALKAVSEIDVTTAQADTVVEEGIMLQPMVAEKEEYLYQLETTEVTIRTQDGSEHKFTVEIADEEEERAEGMMHRGFVPDNSGMLFVFDEPAERAFWMKNTLVPLDILFVKMDGTIHNIAKNAIPQDLTALKSNGPVSRGLEIKGGISDRLGIKPGDIVINDRFFTNKLAPE